MTIKRSSIQLVVDSILLLIDKIDQHELDVRTFYNPLSDKYLLAVVKTDLKGLLSFIGKMVN